MNKCGFIAVIAVLSAGYCTILCDGAPPFEVIRQKRSTGYFEQRLSADPWTASNLGNPCRARGASASTAQNDSQVLNIDGRERQIAAYVSSANNSVQILRGSLVSLNSLSLMQVWRHLLLCSLLIPATDLNWTRFRRFRRATTCPTSTTRSISPRLTSTSCCKTSDTAGLATAANTAGSWEGPGTRSCPGCAPWWSRRRILQPRIHHRRCSGDTQRTKTAPLKGIPGIVLGEWWEIARSFITPTIYWDRWKF